MASGLAGKPSAFVSSDVAFDGEPIVGSFTVDGLTFAVIDESRVELVGVAPSVALSGGSEAGVVEGPDEGHASLILPESVTYEGATYALVSIGAFAFYLSGVESVTLSASVSHVDERAFRSSDVARADVDQANPALSSYDGALYSADTTRILLVPEGRSGQLRIPSRAASLLPEAFSHCASLEGFAVDAGCPAFSSGDGILYDGSGETLLRVAPGAAEATIREGCTTIAAGALEACAKLTTINAPASVTSISPDIFHAVPTVSLPAASAILSEGNEVEGSNDGQAGEASTQLTAMVALSSTDDGLPTIDPAGIMVSLLEGAAVDIWETRGFRVAGSFDPSASTIATLQSAESYAAGIVVYGNGGGVNVWRGKGVGGATTVDPASVVTLASGASQYAWPENTAQVWNNRIDMWSAGNVYYYSLTPARTGYRFTGWTGAVTVSASATSPVTATSGNIYANWTANSYTVEYWNKAGTTKLSSDTGFKYDTARNLAAKPTTGVNAGYTAVGWAASANQSAKAYDFGSSQKNLAASGTKKLYLAETANTITLTWNSQGGSAVSNTSKAYAPGAKVPMPATTSRSGYTFAGWWTSATGGTQVSASTALPTSNKTYYAHWSLNPYAITYDLAGGTVSGNPTTYDVTTTTFTLKNPTRTGYAFAGWSGTGLMGSANKTVTIAKGSTGNRTYTAHWSKNAYDVTFDAAGGAVWGAPTWTPDSPKITFDLGSWNVVTVAERSGYTFKGWYTAASGGAQIYAPQGDGTAASVSDGTYWKNGAWVYPGNMVFYAQWEGNAISLTWDTQDGNAPASTHQVYADSAKLAVPSDPMRTGYIFQGWYTASSGGTRVSASTPLPVASTTYFAHWAPALSADIPVEVEARVDVLGMEEQEPATGYIESRCGEPLKVAEVSMEPLTGATELFGAGNESQVQLQALAGQGAVWQPGGANASFAFPLGPLGSSATEADPSKLAPLCMAKYGDRVPVSYRFSIPEALLATLTETTKPVCSVSYTVTLV